VNFHQQDEVAAVNHDHDNEPEDFLEIDPEEEINFEETISSIDKYYQEEEYLSDDYTDLGLDLDFDT
jgi:hypothetical protein